MSRLKGWSEELQRSLDTLAAIKAFVAPSPRQATWLSSTERAIALMSEHVAGVTQAKSDAARLVAELEGTKSR